VFETGRCEGYWKGREIKREKTEKPRIMKSFINVLFVKYI
jgi:hypothetical protein